VSVLGRHRRASRRRGIAIAAVILLLITGTAILVIRLNRDAPTTPTAATGPGAPLAIAASATPTGPGSPRPSAIRPSPSASASAAKPSPSVSARAPKPPGTAPATSSRKGVSVWSFKGVDTALVESGASWYYTWATGHGGVTTPRGVDFVPMIWGHGSVTDSSLAAAKSAGHELLGFNEPDMSQQADMSVEQALDDWPRLEATGLTLGSPAVAYGGDTPGGWLDSFMSGAAKRGYRVDFIALHWYGSDFRTADAVAQLKSYLQAVYQRYHKPIWLTEYALINFSGGTSYPTGAQQAAFVTASTRMLDGLPYLQRYAWFALPAKDSGPSTGLFTSGPTATAAGVAFEAAR
jgi:hypothetical protein